MRISKFNSLSALTFPLLILAALSAGCDTGTRQATCILGHHTREALDETDRSLQRLLGKARSQNLDDLRVRGEIDFLGTRLREITSENLRETIEYRTSCDPEGQAPCAERYRVRTAGRIYPPRFFEWAAAYTSSFSNVNLVEYDGSRRSEKPEYADARELWQGLSTLAQGLSELHEQGMAAFEDTRPAARIHELRMLIRRIRQNRVSERIEFGCAAADLIEGDTSQPGRSTGESSRARSQSQATRAERELDPEEPVRRRPRDAGVRSFPTDAAW